MLSGSGDHIGRLAMTPLREQLLKRLRDDGFVEHTRRWIREVVAQADGLHLYGDDMDRADLASDWQASLDEAFSAVGRGHPEDHFGPIIQQLSGPAIVTAEEISDLFWVYLPEPDSGFDDDEFEEMYGHFLDHLSRHVLRERQSQPLKVAKVTDLPSDAAADAQAGLKLPFLGYRSGKAEVLGEAEAPDLPDFIEDEEHEPVDIAEGSPLWSHEDIRATVSHLELRGHVTRSTVHRHDEGLLYMRLRGHLSRRCLRNLQNEFLQILTAVLRTVVSLQPGWQSRLAHDVVEIPAATLTQHLAFIRGALTTTLEGRRKGDHFRNRIANAVRLLAEADRQPSTALGIALCVTAIESLVGIKGTELKRRISDIVATLLEPRTAHRDQAVKFVAHLYDIRSDVLHGTRLDGEANTLRNARRLASAVLYAVWFYADFKQRYDDQLEKPDRWLADLDGRRSQDGLPGGVPEIAEIWSLWQRGNI